MRMPVVLLLLTILPISTSTNAQTSSDVILISGRGTMLDVSAEGRAIKTPNIATIRAGVVSQGSSAASVLTDIAQRLPRILAILQQAGVATQDISTSDMSLAPRYQETPNQPAVIAGYQATNTLAIRFRDVGKAGAIVDALVSQGANQIEGPDLSIDEPDTAVDEARIDALRRAQSRAALYARNLGLRVERIVSITERTDGIGGGIPLAELKVASANDGTRVIAGSQDVKMIVRVRFLLRK